MKKENFQDQDYTRDLIKAIRYTGSQQALANAIGASQQQINYWLNQAIQIPYEEVIKIEFITQGYVTRHKLAPYRKKLNSIIHVLYHRNTQVNCLSW